ncbi:ATP-dependent DNA helicase [Ruminococcaceae bacterium OttesenSCG-928-D13]|nr:ATP-dependent DNA helicase [Ruminococcaceae bacterium OttesenSCG-928-D13]
MDSIIETEIPDIRNLLHERKLLPIGAETVLLLGSCVLVEMPKGNRYAYFAVSILDGQARKLFELSQPIDKSSYNHAAEKMMAMPFYIANELPDGEKRAVTLLQRVFTNILPSHGFVYRESQLTLSLTILNALWHHKIALCEAGVGSGKTLAYVMATIVHGLFCADSGTAILSTSTIALQKALTEEYLPQISDILSEHRILDRPLTFVVRKGKSHYACDARLHTYLSSVRNLGKDNKLIRQLVILQREGVAAIDLSQHPLTRYVKDCICVQGRCQLNCPMMDRCRYQAFTRMCLERKYDFQVTNHNYVLAHLLGRKEKKRDILPPYRLIVFDEAHKLLDAARQMYGRQWACSEVPNLLQTINEKRMKDKANRRVLAGWKEMLLARNKQLFDALAGRYPQSMEEAAMRMDIAFSPAMIAMVGKICEGLSHLADMCRHYGDRRIRAQVADIRSHSEELMSRLAAFTGDTDSVYWLESLDADPTLCAIPKNIPELLQDDLWASRTPSILTSGTLSAGGCFSLIKRDLGIDRVAAGRLAQFSVPSPFNYRSNTLLYIPEGMPFPENSNPAYIQAVVEQIRLLVQATHGHTLILFTSYWLMERVHSMLHDELANRFPVFLLSRGRVDTLVAFRKSSNGVLFASDAAGEGVDLAGDILSSLIIVRLPFEVPDPITRQEQTEYANLHDYLRAVTLPRMLIKLRQYCGRAIRREEDTAVISILDCRVAYGGKYRENVLNALPPSMVTKDIHDVAAFIRDKKDDAYFL